MGSRIAAHLANAGIPVLLLDMVPTGDGARSRLALAAIEALGKAKPAAFYEASLAALITHGNFEDDLGKLAGCDWVVEAVAENLAIKTELLARVLPHLAAQAVLTTNTSGLPIKQIVAGLATHRERFFGTHFFNPPRYMKLLEVIPTAESDAGVVAAFGAFADRTLGKQVVRAGDTPNFIANRIGSFMGGTIGKTMLEDDFSIEEVDALTGPLIGVPSSASFRLLDLVGLDVWGFVGTNLYELVPNDPWRERFLPLEFEKKMIEQKWLGDKTGQGFYKRVGKGDALSLIHI